MKTRKGYRLHWEGSDENPIAFSTMRQVREEIALGAKEGEITLKQAKKIAYILTEEVYQQQVEEEAYQQQLTKD